MEMFRVRIVKVDHYMVKPIPGLDVTYSDFRKATIKSLPVIRIFGCTPTGEKTCVHVHGVFPYICIPYDGSEPYLKLAHQVAASLDKAINIASGFSTSNTQHVYKVVLVAGVPFYGYHRKRHQFLKIYFFKPSVIKQAVSLLQNGAILNKIFQPHEAHIPFILQFFIDFNLYELLSKVSPELILPSNIPAVSLSQYEVDALACDVANRPSSQGNGQISNPGLAAIWEDEHRRRAASVGTPLDVPHLHSQRPSHKSTPSELFFLETIQRVLNNPSQNGNDSSLSGEGVALSNKSYAIEVPPNTQSVDASFVSLHVSESHPDNQNLPDPDVNLDDTIVDEDVALMNLTLSQRASQTLERSIALDYEDLDLLHALESLADNRSVTVDNDSILGSQTSRGKSAPHPTMIDREESGSEGEDDIWEDKTLVAEEDEVKKLLDLTMPDIDEAAIISDWRDNHQAGSSGCPEDLKIPQIDGASSLQSDQPRHEWKVPQLDGLNDIPSTFGRKSLGMRGGVRNKSAPAPKQCAKRDTRYNSEGELIFKLSKPSTESAEANNTRSNSEQQTDKSDSSAEKNLPTNLNNPLAVLVPSQRCSQDHLLARIQTDTLPTISSACEVPLADCSEPDLFDSLAQSSLLNSSLLSVPNLLSEPDPFRNLLDEPLDSLLTVPHSTEEQIMAPFFHGIPLPDQDVVQNFQPPVACCSAAATGCTETCSSNFDGDHDCVDIFIDELSKRNDEPVLRGDPSLYPQLPPEKEESLADFLTSEVCKANSEGESGVELRESCGATSASEEDTIASRVRRSSRQTSHESTPHNLIVGPETSVSHLFEISENPFVKPVDEENPEASPCSCCEFPGISGFSTTMFDDIAASPNYSALNGEAGCSDSELYRLSGALANNQMEEILQSGEEVLNVPSTSRAEELMNYVLQSQKASDQPDDAKPECQGICSKSIAKRRSAAVSHAISSGDLENLPQISELGEKAKKGPPRLGKNMALAKLYCGTPKEPSSRKKSTDEKYLIREARKLRKKKLSITVQRRNREPVLELAPLVEKLTKFNINRVCKANKVKLKDKSALCVRRYSTKPSTSLVEVNSASQGMSKNLRRSSIASPSREPLKSTSLFGGRFPRSCHKPPSHQRKEEPSEIKDQVNKNSPLSVTEESQSIKCPNKTEAVVAGDKKDADHHSSRGVVQGQTEKNLSGHSSQSHVAGSSGSCKKLSKGIVLTSKPQNSTFKCTIKTMAKSEVSEKITALHDFDDVPLSQRVKKVVKKRQSAFGKEKVLDIGKQQHTNSSSKLNSTDTLKISSAKNSLIRDNLVKSEKEMPKPSSQPLEDNDERCVNSNNEHIKSSLRKNKNDNKPAKGNFRMPQRSNQVQERTEGPESNRLSADFVTKRITLRSGTKKNKSVNEVVSVLPQEQSNKTIQSDVKQNSTHVQNVETHSSRKSGTSSCSVSSEKSTSGQLPKARKAEVKSDVKLHKVGGNSNVEAGIIRSRRTSFKSSSSQGENLRGIGSPSPKAVNPGNAELFSTILEKKWSPSSSSSAVQKRENLRERRNGNQITRIKDVHFSPRKSPLETKDIVTYDTIEHNPADGLKNYRIPKIKKNTSLQQVNFSECVNGSDSRKEVTVKVTAVSACTSSASISAFPGRSKDEWMNNDDSDTILSLETSDIQLSSSDDTQIEPLSCNQAHLQSRAISTGGINSCIPGLQVQGRILCVDGVGGISSDSSDSQSSDQATTSAHAGLKRKSPNQDDEIHSKSGKGYKRQENESDLVLSDEAQYPESMARWFRRDHSSWTHISSPRAHHEDYLSSPRHLKSPDKSHRSESATGCMRQAAAPSFQDSTVHSQSSKFTCTSMEFKTNHLKKNTNIEWSPIVEDHSSGKASNDQSIVDMFSDKSLDPDLERNRDEKNQAAKSILSFSVNASPSRNNDSSLECVPEHASSSKPMVAASTSFKSSGSLLNGDAVFCRDLSSSEESTEASCDKHAGALRTESRNQSTCSNYYFGTLQKPPSRRDVMKSLSSLNLPVVINPEPYCSNYLDVKGKTEVGGNILDLTSKSCLHLEEFRSSISGLRGLSVQQRDLFGCLWGLSQIHGDLNQLISHHSVERMIIIAPVKKPPRVRDVALWGRARQIILEKKNAPKEEIAIPLRSEASSQNAINLSSHSQSSKPSPSYRIMKASTPDVGRRQFSGCEVPSPLLTPILQPMSQHRARSTSTKSKKYLKALVHLDTPMSPMPSINEGEEEEEDMGVRALGSEGTEIPNASHGEKSHDSSLNRFLLDSGLCREMNSPAFRHASDASACQVKGVSSSPEFKLNFENLQTVKTLKEHQYITTLIMELHICTCGTLNPDPERDHIRAIFYSVVNDVPENAEIPSQINGIIAVDGPDPAFPVLKRCGIEAEVEYACDEKSLVHSLICLVRKWDPDILAGFEIEMLSWGYILQRAGVLGVNLVQELSRIPTQKEGKQTDEFEDNNGLSGLKITGRIVLDVWRVFRSEVALQSYTYENLMYHVLHERVSHHSYESLSRWWEHPSHLHRWITVRYYQQRVSGIIRLLDQLDIIGRTSELARLFGIQFFEVLSRGSQFRVESMMLRLAKPLNYIPVSPSIQQRAHMRAPESLPLIMEPESRFYKDPLIVLDFQSLYPSMIIAYNYCFSTCLGRVEHLGKSSYFEFGCSELRVTNSHLQQLQDNITVSPSGIAFVTKAVREGVLPKMLEEILEARLAVKQSMKHHKGDTTLQRVLHARQLGLKLIANVTYGYTSANFSGRMPCIEVGDSVVSKGRETLERAITMVQKNSKWQARVVYGDTDSLFVLVPGRSRQEAFRIGAEIADAVTQDNPSPVKLKLEKVYQPSILQTKKRYVGFMYESADQEVPVYEAKGIETVRRDGCPAVAKMLEKTLRILFETCDVSLVKNYVSHQFSKILAGRANIQDLIFAREYRGKENYRPGACVPALELTKRWLRHDRRSEPRIGERVPYVVVNGPPGSALIHLVRHPSEVLADPSLRYNAVYYVTRAIIPPLARCLSLLGADVARWYSDLPRKSQLFLPRISHAGSKKTISQYFTTMDCACCGALTHGGVCSKCRLNPQLVVASLMSKLHNWESTHLSITQICQSCLGRMEPLDCCSLDCPISFRRHQSSQKQEQSAFILGLLKEYIAMLSSR